MPERAKASRHRRVPLAPAAMRRWQSESLRERPRLNLLPRDLVPLPLASS